MAPVPRPLVELLSRICGVIKIGDLDGRIPTVEGTVNRNGQTWMCQTSAYGADPDAVLLTKSIWPGTVPPNRRPQVDTLIARVNWALLVGNAEMDHRDGTVRFRTSLYLGRQALSDALAEGLVLPNLGTAALLFPHVAAVVTSSADPAAAAERLIDDVESGAILLKPPQS